VIELDELARRAPPPRFAHERALAAVPLPDRPHDVRRDVPGIRRGAWLIAAWTVRCREPGFLQLRNERVQRPLEDLGDTAGGNLVAEQLLRVAQLGVSPRTHRELHLERLSRQWFHLGTIHMPRGM